MESNSRINGIEKFVDGFTEEVSNRIRARGVDTPNPQVLGIVREVFGDYVSLNPLVVQNDELVNQRLLGDISGSERIYDVLRAFSGTSSPTVEDALSLYEIFEKNPSKVRGYGKISHKHLKEYLFLVEENLIE